MPKIPGHTNSNTGGTGTTTTNGTMTFNLDGTSKTAATVLGVYDLSQSMIQVDGFMGTTASGEGLSITIQNPTVGTFPITSANTLCVYNVNDTADSFIGATGTVVITTLTSDTFAGTFSFNAQTLSGNATKNVTNGKFSVKYVKQ